MWASLNEDGKKVWGDIFPDGKVPVTSMNFSQSNLGSVVLVSWNALSKSQQKAILSKISAFSGDISEEIILADIKKKGLPLRKEYTNGVIVAELRYFI